MTDILQPPAHPSEPANAGDASPHDAPPAASTPGAATVPPLRMTFDEFMAFDPEVGRAEWVDGEVILVSPASSDHQLIFVFLIQLLGIYIGRHKPGILYASPFLMRLANRPSGREPDVLFVANEHIDRIKPAFLDGPADLAIEIVSPDSQTRDLVDKLNEYEAAKLPEYWVIDWIRQNAFFFLLGEDGRYHTAPVGQDGFYRSRVLAGFRLRVDWLWRRPLPFAEEAFREMEASSRS